MRFTLLTAIVFWLCIWGGAADSTAFVAPSTTIKPKVVGIRYGAEKTAPVLTVSWLITGLDKLPGHFYRDEQELGYTAETLAVDSVRYSARFAYTPAERCNFHFRWRSKVDSVTRVFLDTSWEWSPSAAELVELHKPFLYNRSKSAYNWAQLLVQKWPECADLHYLLAEQAANEMHPDKAIAETRLLVGLMPARDSLWKKLLAHARSQGLQELELIYARALLQTDSTKNNRQPWPWMNIDVELVQGEMVPEAWLFGNQAQSYYLAGDYRSALNAIRMARRFDSSDRLAWKEIALLLSMDSLSRAESVWDSLPEKESTLARSLRVSILHATGRDSLARMEYLLISSDSLTGALAMNSALISLMQGHALEAKTILQTSNGHSYSNASLLAQGYAEMVSGKMLEACKTYQSLTNVAPLSPDLLWGLARCAELNGDSRSAIMNYAGAIAMRRNFEEAIYSMSNLMLAEGWFVQAEENFRFLLQRNPNNYKARQGFASALFGLKRNSEAAREFDLAVKQKAGLRIKKRYAPIVAVMRLDNYTGKAELNWVGTSVAEALTSTLQDESDYQVAERIHVERALRRSDNTKDVSMDLGADFIVQGGMQGDSASIRFDIRMVELSTGKIVATASVDGSLSSLGILQRSISRKLLGLSVDSASLSRDQNDIALEARQKMAEAQETFYQGNEVQARALTEAAWKMDARILGELGAATLIDRTEALKKVLAVLPFKQEGGTAKDRWMSAGIQEAIITDMKKVSGVYMVERSQIDKILGETALVQAGLVDEKSVSEYGEKLLATSVIVGEYSGTSDSIWLTARLFSVPESRLVVSKSIAGKRMDLLKLEEKLAFALMDTLGIGVSGYERRRVIDKDPLALQTLENRIAAEMDSSQKSNQDPKTDWIGRSLIVSTTLASAITGINIYRHMRDRDDYNSVTDPESATAAGDKAEDSWNGLLVTAIVTGVLFSGTIVWYWLHSTQ